MNQITARTLDAWLVAIKKPEYLALQHGSRVSYRHELSVLRRILVYYINYIDDNYQMPLKSRHLDDSIVDLQRYQQSKDKNKAHFIPRTHFEGFLAKLHERATEKPAERGIIAVLAEFQLGTGVRIGEACALSWEDIDLDSGAVFISKTVQWSRKKGRQTCISPLTKTGESRAIFMSDRAINALRLWKSQQTRTKGLIFSYDGFAPLTYRAVQHHYDRVFQELGMKWRSTHIMRHSYATDFLEKTNNRVALQGQLGHVTSKQTDHYAKITATAVQAGVRAYNDSLKTSNVVELFGKPEAKNLDLLGAAGRTGVNKS